MISPSPLNGFTLLEVLMVILLLGVLSIAGLSVLGPNIDETRFNQTVQRMRKLQVAMAGDPAILENNVRTSFGYLGDIGALPAGITGFVTNPGLPAYGPHAGARIGLDANANDTGTAGALITGASVSLPGSKARVRSSAFTIVPTDRSLGRLLGNGTASSSLNSETVVVRFNFAAQ